MKTPGGVALPLTAAQAEIWFDEQFATGPLAYNMADCIELTGPLDAALLGRALRRLGEEAEGLRVRFTDDDGTPQQVVCPLGELPLTVIDLSSEAAPRAAADRWMEADLAEPLKVTDFPLFRSALLKLGPEQHLLYLCMHHILSDGYSRALMYPKLATLYAQLADGLHERDLDAAAIPAFHRLVDAERDYLASRHVERDRAYWTGRLVDAPDSSPELVSLSAREPAPGRGTLRHTARLTPDATRALRDMASDGKVTMPVLMVAAMAAYVQRVTGVAEPLLTLPVTARVGAVSREIPGMLANYLPLAVRVRPGMTRNQLLRSAWTEVAGALKHQRYRGDRVRRDMGLRIDDRRAFGPFINVLNQDPELAFGPACRGVVTNLSTGIVNDLIMTVLNGADGSLEIHLDGNPELYEDAELAAHLHRFEAFVGRLAAMDPETPLARVDVVAPGETAGLLHGPARDDAYEGVVELVSAVAARTPDVPAVVDPSGTVTYAELVRRAGGVAARLGAAAVPERSVVAVLADPGTPFVAGILGVLGAGCAWLPLDPAAPHARNAGLLRDSGARLLLVGAEHEDVALAFAGEVPVLPLAAPEDAQNTRALPARGGALDLAYVMFTSGSTGRPKGAMVHRAGMVNHLWAKVGDLDLKAGEAVVQNAPLTFDVSVWQMLAPLIVGGRVRVSGVEMAADPTALFGAVRDERVDVLEVVPSLLRAALDSWDVEEITPELPSLCRLMVTGEALPVDLCERWFARFPGVPLINAYGPTECSDDVTHAVIRAGDRQPSGRVPIGGAVRNTRLYVLSDELRPVPAGVPGELYVGGAGVGRGYLDDPVRTAGTFMADPFGPAGARMYRTGDRVVQRPDGQLEFIERRDHQVKIRGRRVETGEIETVVRSLDSVADAAVAVLPDASGNPRLVAYLTGEHVDASRVRTELAGLLPEYMVPSTWLVLDAMPLTANGKLDRKALPLPAETDQASTRRGPRDERERLLTGIFSDVLGIADVGVDEDFFVLGGDSIRSIQVVSRARKAGLALTTRDVFTRKTVAALAAVATEADTAARTTRDDGTGVVDLTPIAAQLHEDTRTLSGPVVKYSQHVVVRVPAGLDAARLDAALHTLVDHHDALRLRAHEPAPGLWQLDVLPKGSVADAELVTEADASAVKDLPGFAERQAAAARARLDPAAGVMIQAVLLRTGTADDTDRLVIAAHHLVVDGVSWRILLPDLADACAGRTPEPVGTSYRAWSRLLTEQARTEVRGPELALWQRTLTGPDPLVGTRRLDPAKDVYGTLRTLRLELPPHITAPLLTDVPAAFRAEVNDVLLTGLALAVADWRRRHGHAHYEQTLIELEGHGREQLADDLDLSRTVGWFTSAFPVRLDPGTLDWDEVWAGGPALATALKRVKECLRELPDRGLGFGLLRYLNPHAARTLAAYDRPQIGFNYMGRFDTRNAALWEPAGGDGVVGTGAHPGMPLPHLLDVTPATEDRADGPHLIANWTWAGESVSAEDAADVAHTWFRALEVLAAHATDAGGLTPSDLPLVAVEQPEIETYERELAELSPAARLTDVLPLTPLQQGMLFHAELAEAAGAAEDADAVDVYTLQIVTDLEGDVDPGALRAAGTELLRRHPNLRACFRARESGEPVQLVPDTVDLPWCEADLTTLPEAGRAAALARLTEEERTRRFDLTSPPLLRFTLVKMAEGEYRFIWTSHHVLVDGWSMPLLVRELFTLCADGASAALPDVAPYRDHLAWLAGQDRDAARAAWRGALAGVEEPTLLTAADPHRVPALPDSVHLEVPRALTAELAAWARGRGLTLNTVVQGCWAVLLGRLTGRRDVVFGAVTSGRPAEVPGVESMVGMFLNTVPVRARLAPDATLAQLLTALQEQQTELLAHEHLGLAEILKAAGLGGEVFDTVLLFENFPLDADGMDSGASGVRVVRAEAKDARHHPLSMAVYPGDSLSLRLDYAPDLFGRADVEQLAARFIQLLRTVADTPELPLARVDVVLPDARDGLLGEWDPALVEESVGVVERVRSVAARIPDETAVTDPEGSVAYGRLVALAGGLSTALTGAGAETGTVAAMLCDPGAPFVGGILGVLGAGAAWLPLDPAAPDARNAGLLRDSGARFLLAGPGHEARARELAAGTPVTVLSLAEALTPADTLPPCRGGGLDLAYVMYTSGSTGRPKGAMVHRAGMLNHLWAKVGDLDLKAGETVVQNAPLTFDVSVWQMLAPLVVGGRVRVSGVEMAADPTALFGAVRDERVEVLEVVPSLLRAALDAWDLEGVAPELPALRRLMVTGEALPVDLCERWFARFPGVPLINAYGPTECSDDVTHAVIRAGDRQPSGRVPIGGAVRNTRLYVLSDELRPVPVGVPGELYVGGAGVGRGYLDDPVRTAGTFMADPFAGAGKRMYRTGDRVVQRPDGQLEFIERRDHQVKIRGRRVELGEIEAVLRALDAVADAAVAVLPDASGNSRLVGYLTGDGLTGPDDAEPVRARAAALLPEYMVPSTWVVLDALPLTANGKLDRKALPEPAETDQASARRGPRDERERLLAGIFADVLGIADLGVDEDFFVLGGDSIRSIQVVSRARRAGLALTTRDVFAHKTVAALAAVAADAEDVVETAVPEVPEGGLVTLDDDELADLELELSEELS
ncbi:non-ribosomal peptide synthetase [Streptomyces alfalfae]|uniref:Non-ribosomal peptide synthetase n=11 Tax=Streptomyces TaxID=1883 RepID=A0ABN4VK14_9ACTN|nr:non-ribosomal peptide synthetase [Streptomyces alfalfae]APY87122.1 non-ribosomal peptide synthetase [Streptomyces alfalfae]AYA17521.1 non-ribosomal peptide synthetase [Streptomyces fradiae]